MVYSVQEKTIHFINLIFPKVDKYIIDGCSTHYKKLKTMMNLCCHVTNHGKTICDGIRDTVKRTTMKKTLQSTEDGENKCTTFVIIFSKIKFLFLSQEDIEPKNSR